MFLGGKGNKNKPQKKGIENMKYLKFTIKNENVELADNFLKTEETSEKELALYGQELVEEFRESFGNDDLGELNLTADYKEITEREYEEEL